MQQSKISTARDCSTEVHKFSKGHKKTPWASICSHTGHIFNVWLIWNLFKQNVSLYISITSLLENKCLICNWPILSYKVVVLSCAGQQECLMCVMCGANTPIPRQIQLLHSKNREGTTSTPDSVRRWTQEREQSVLNRTATHSLIKTAMRIHVRSPLSNNEKHM